MAHVYNINLPLSGGGGGVDTSKDTVAPEVLEKGYTAHDKDGNPITGTLDTEAIRAEGVEAGKKSEYDAFWDSYQQNGNRIQYFKAFAGYGWNDTTFKPKYSIIPEEASELFIWGRFSDIYAWMDFKGLVLDFSNCISGDHAFGYCTVEHLRVLDFSKFNRHYYTFFNAARVRTIEKLCVVASQTFQNVFWGCNALVNLTIEGTIGQNGFNASWSPLNKASLTSVVNALSSTTTGLTVTLRLDAVNTAFETSAGAADGSTSEEWLALAATKPNWTINLINS